MPDYRAEFADFSPTIYLDCAYQGPFPRATVARIERAIELKSHPDRLGPDDYFDLPDSVRARLARLIGADPSEVALTNSATQGIGVAVTGLAFAPGDEVVIASSNFPSNLFSWLHLKRHGVLVNVLRPVLGRVRLEDVAASLGPRTRVLALDWVSYAEGLTIDLAALGELAHRNGSLFVVDGTQGVGSMELNVHDLPVDVLAVAAYKWLLGPYGTGFVYIGQGVQDRLDLGVINWLAVEGSEDFDALPFEDFTLPRQARIFDVPGTSNFLNLYAFEASLEFVERAGIRAVNAHCGKLLDGLEDGLRQKGFTILRNPPDEPRSAILGFQARTLEATAAVHRRLRDQHIAVSLRHGIIRVSPYLYNTKNDIDRLLSHVGGL